MKTYVVIIHYREPTFDLRQPGGAHRMRVFVHDLPAKDASGARWGAMAEFQRAALLSSVGWVREAVAVQVAEVGKVATAGLA
jgi:hypothetical protein